MAKVHLHSEQFDGAMHPQCGRGSAATPAAAFEATEPASRRALCARYWLPNGQPGWHLKQAQKRAESPTP